MLMRPGIVAALACPHDGGQLQLADRVLGCASGHRFDLAKQGYATLIRQPLTHQGDPAALIDRRVRVHRAGLLDALHQAVVAAACTAGPAARPAAGPATGPAAGPAAGPTAGPPPEGVVCDVGAGPGSYLAAVLDAVPGQVGLAVDASRAAARRAARCHERAGAVVADVWQGLPLRSGSVSLLLDVFAPRDATEFARVLVPGGTLLVVTPQPEHLAELRGAFDLLSVGPAKAEQLRAQLGAAFEETARELVATTIDVTPAQAADLAGMGASGHHLDVATLDRRARELPARTSVRIAVTLSRFVRTHDPPSAARAGPKGADDGRR